MPETMPLIKAALNLRVGAGFDVYVSACHSEAPFLTGSIIADTVHFRQPAAVFLSSL